MFLAYCTTKNFSWLTVLLYDILCKTVPVILLYHWVYGHHHTEYQLELPKRYLRVRIFIHSHFSFLFDWTGYTSVLESATISCQRTSLRILKPVFCKEPFKHLLDWRSSIHKHIQKWCWNIKAVTVVLLDYLQSSRVSDLRTIHYKTEQQMAYIIHHGYWASITGPQWGLIGHRATRISSSTHIRVNCLYATWTSHLYHRPKTPIIYSCIGAISPQPHLVGSRRKTQLESLLVFV